MLCLVNATTDIFCFKSDNCSYQYKYVATDDFSPSFTNDIYKFLLEQNQKEIFKYFIFDMRSVKTRKTVFWK